MTYIGPDLAESTVLRRPLWLVLLVLRRPLVGADRCEVNALVGGL